jgi:glycosyltransferase involved in cell wall biosynthesis
MKHFIFYMTDFNGGGAESVFTRVANSLIKRKQDVTFIVKKNRGELLKTIDPCINIIELNSTNILSDILLVRGCLKKHNFERFYTTLDRPNLVGFLASILAGTKDKHFARVAAVHSEHILQTTFFKRKLLLRVLGILYPMFANIISVSEAVKADLIETYFVPGHKIVKIYNPTKPISNSTHSPRIKGHDRAFKILIVGRLVKQKNVDKIITVFAQFLEFEPYAELEILGDGEDRSCLERLAFELKIADKVKFRGFVENLDYYFQQADLFILFSSWEGLPNVVLDALVNNVQIIVSDAPGGSRELTDNGRYGRVVANEDEQALLQAMISAGSNPMQVDNTAKQEFLCQFDLERVTDLYEGAIRETA